MAQDAHNDRMEAHMDSLLLALLVFLSMVNIANFVILVLLAHRT